MIAAARAAVRGFLTFAVLAAIGVAIGLAEYAASGGAYRLWTWIKVGFLYLVSFCGVSIRAQSAVPPGVLPQPTTVDFRLPMMLGTALAVWLLFRAGRAATEASAGRPGVAAGATASAALAFAVPTFLVSLPATLRFPEIATLAPVRWQAALFPLLLAVGATLSGALWAWHMTGTEADTGSHALRAVAAGGWTMFVASLVLALIGFLVLAALKPDQTSAYARYLRGRGAFGAVLVTHHVLFLPAQSVWMLAPAMGGSTTLTLSGRAPGDRTVVRMSRIEEGAVTHLVCPAGSLVPACRAGIRLPLGGGFYLFVLVPLGAALAGGRRAARNVQASGRRAALGAGAGVVFTALIALAAWFSATTIPWGAGSLLVTIHADMPTTAVLALAWGVGGGVLGALTAGIGPQAPAPD